MYSGKKSFIDCIKQENESSQDSTSASSKFAIARFSFINSQDKLSLFNHRSIYIDSMKRFIASVKQTAKHLSVQEELSLLLDATKCIDLTTLAGDDVASNVERLCHRALKPFDMAELPEFALISCPAVCVYPARICDCVNAFRKLGSSRVKIASVATGFPSGQYNLKTRVMEVVHAVESGANEVDVVINRAAALQGNWVCMFQELTEMRKACDVRLDDGHKVCMKVIVGAGDLLTVSPNTLYFASIVAIVAGADFIKTSTGKETVNATLSIGFIMLRSIIDYYDVTGIKVGFKAAGGIRTDRDAVHWMLLLRTLLGPEWNKSDLFRIGASGLLDSIERRVRQLKSIKEQRTLDNTREYSVLQAN